MKNKFEKLVNFIGNKKIITRKELTKFFPEMKDLETIDCYRNYLTQAGYLEIKSLGVYEVKCRIPTNISMREVRRQAYDYRFAQFAYNHPV